MEKEQGAKKPVAAEGGQPDKSQQASGVQGIAAEQPQAAAPADDEEKDELLSDVFCSSQHGIALSDGRELMPGDSAKGIDLLDPHNAALLEDGHLTMKEDN